MVVDASGNYVSRSPKFTANADLNYLVPIRSGQIKVALSYYYNIGFYFTPNNNVKQGGYGILNLRTEFTSASGHWNYALWGQNLAGARYLVGVVPDTLTTLAQYGAPRTYGVTIGYTY